MAVVLRDKLRLARLRERLEDRPNDLGATVRAAHLEYNLRLYDEAQRSIVRALELGHVDDGTMQIQLARIHVRRHNVDTSNSRRDLTAALASFSEALKFKSIALTAVHYLEVTSVYLKLNETQRAANALSTVMLRWPWFDDIEDPPAFPKVDMLVSGERIDRKDNILLWLHTQIFGPERQPHGRIITSLLHRKNRLTETETQNATARLEQSKEATLATETCAQTLLARGQASEALPYYQALLVDPPETWKVDQTDGSDHAEVDLPVAGTILGNESIVLQMGLCYESLGQRQMASEANRQAWKALLQQRDRALELDLSTRINSEVTAARHDHIGRTLRQARVKLGITTSVDPLGEIQGRMRGNSFKGRVTPTTGEERFSLFSSPAHVTAEGGTTNEKLTQRMPGSKRVIDSSPTGCNNENKTALSTPGPFSEGRQDCPSPRSLMEKYSDRGRVVHEDGASKAEAMAAEAAARTLGFELWHKNPFTWFEFGEALLKGSCHALALAFLEKAVALLSPGLEQQEKEKHLPVYMRRRRKPGESDLKAPSEFGLAHLHLLRAEALFQMGRFSDAHSEAEKARDLEPFGRAVRRLCPRLMALHCEDARSQYTRENLAAVRLQRAWRGHWLVSLLTDIASKQIAAMRIQRFMRGWRERNRGLTARLAIASAIELSQTKTTCARGLGPTAKAAAQERLDDIARSAVVAQRAGRVLIARCRVSRWREAMYTLQAFFRGCKARLSLTIYLEQRYQYVQRNYGGGSCDFKSGAGDDRGKEQYAMQVGRVTRCDLPMDAGCPGGFDAPNLAAFLWETPGNDANDFGAQRPRALPSDGKTTGPCTGSPREEAVFELSATTILPSAAGDVTTRPGGLPQGTDGEMWPTTLGHLQRASGPFSSRPSPQLLLPPVLWLSPAVAPEAVLAKALQCTTLVVSSPSFCSVAARRLFSRIGRPLPLSTEQNTCLSISEATTRQELEGEAIKRELRRTAPPLRQGYRLTHILVLGASPMGDGGLSELSYAVRHGWLSLLTTLVVGGSGCRVGPRGVTALATALSSSGCSNVRSLSLSYCCLGRRRRRFKKSSVSSRLSSACVADAIETAQAHTAWDCFFRHLQRMPALSSLSLQDCGIEDCDVRFASIAIQILPAGVLRCLRLSENRIGVPGVRMLLRALTSRRMRLPALWLRKQRPALVEREAMEVVKDAFAEGLFAEVEFEQPRDAMGGRARLAMVEHTAESKSLGSSADKHLCSSIYI